ncbi:MAG: catalase [Lautropia sp.]|nr:catalase [Lautropia sp.]
MNHPQESTHPDIGSTKISPAACHQDSIEPPSCSPRLMGNELRGQAPAHQHPVWVPERMAEVSSSGAYGHFTVTNDISRYTHAEPFSRPGQQTPVFARFSHQPRTHRSDSLPDIHGFAVRFHTGEGDWDLVGQNTPVFFIHDPDRFPALLHALGAAARTDRTAAWDFWSRTPESLNLLTMLLSDDGQPIGARFMDGHGGHTYSLWNARRERFWVRFHFRAEQSPRALIREGAQGGIAPAPEAFHADLHQAIACGDFPSWTLYIQVMPESRDGQYPHDPFDPTRIWSEAEHPLIEVGVMRLDRNLDDRFSRLEPISLSPANLIPGIGHSHDRILQARIFSCTDTIPNRHGGPQPLMTDDEADITPSGHTPSSAPDSPPIASIQQAGARFRLLAPEHQQRLAARMAGSMQDVPATLIDRQLALLAQADPRYARLVREALASAHGATIK